MIVRKKVFSRSLPRKLNGFLNMNASSFFQHSKNSVEKFPEITITMAKREYFSTKRGKMKHFKGP